MREVSYVDGDGRYKAVLLPDGVPDRDASMGLPLGPPPLTSLGLPKETEVRLNNQLFARRIFTFEDAKRRRNDLFGALQSAYAVDGERLVLLYSEMLNGKK